MRKAQGLLIICSVVFAITLLSCAGKPADEWTLYRKDVNRWLGEATQLMTRVQAAESRVTSADIERCEELAAEWQQLQPPDYAEEFHQTMAKSIGSFCDFANLALRGSSQEAVAAIQLSQRLLGTAASMWDELAKERGK